MENNSQKKSRVRKFRKILLEISNQLEKDEVKNMMLMVVGVDGYPGHAQVEKVESGIEFFMMLLKHGKVSADDYNELVDLLDDVSRKDLVKSLCESMKALDNESISADSSLSSPPPDTAPDSPKRDQQSPSAFSPGPPTSLNNQGTPPRQFSPNATSTPTTQNTTKNSKLNLSASPEVQNKSLSSSLGSPNERNSLNIPSNTPGRQHDDLNQTTPGPSPSQNLHGPSNTTPATPSTPNQQTDPSVRPKVRNIPLSSNSSKTTTAIKSNSSPTQNLQKNLSQISANGKLGASKSDGISGDIKSNSSPPQNLQKDRNHSTGSKLEASKSDGFSGDISFQSLKSHPPDVNIRPPEGNNQQKVELQSIGGDESDPDPDDMGGSLEMSAASSVSLEGNNDQGANPVPNAFLPNSVPPCSNQSPANYVQSPESLQRKMEDLSLHGSNADGRAPSDFSKGSPSNIQGPPKMEDLSLEVDASNPSTTGDSSSMMSTDLETDAPDVMDEGSGIDIKASNDKASSAGKINVRQDQVEAGILPKSEIEVAQTNFLDQKGTTTRQDQPGIPQGALALPTGEEAQSNNDDSAGVDEPSEDPQPGENQKQLRAYQMELATPPLSGNNYIICAPTGSGKTLTAAYICQQSYEEAAANETDFKALFIVNIRHLTRQQRLEFKEQFPKGAVRTIEETEQLKDVFFEDGVFVVMVTAQIVVNSLEKQDLSLQDISMIIFDECHHTTQNHPYNEIMKRYLKEKKIKLGKRRVVGKSGDRLPHVIGLSASLGVGHGKAFDHMLTLCGNMDAKNVLQVRENKKELDDHVNAPENDEIRFVLSRKADQRDLSQIIEGIMSQIEDELWEEEDIKHEHGTQGYEQWIKTQEKDAESLPDKRAKFIATIYLFRYNKSLILFEDLRSSDSLEYLEEFMRQRDLEQEHVAMEERCRGLFEAEKVELKRICKVEDRAPNPKLEELSNLLREMYESKPDSKGIILCRTRLATHAIMKFLQMEPALQELQNPVKAVRLVGQGESDNYFMTESDQKNSLKKFRNVKGYNLLIATDIAQEGLDMPACNFVIRFNFVSNEIGTVQSKGRARAKQSECYLIVEEDSINAKREASNRQKVKDMQTAMDELNELTEEGRMQQITEQQDKIYTKLEEKDQMSQAAKGLPGHTLDSVEMLCKECSAYITKASYIAKKGCNYTCTDPDVNKRIMIVPFTKTDRYRDTETTGVFKCANPTCGQKLGIAVNFLNVENGDFSLNGYGFGVKSFRFKFSDGHTSTYEQWQKVPIDIPQED